MTVQRSEENPSFFYKMFLESGLQGLPAPDAPGTTTIGYHATFWKWLADFWIRTDAFDSILDGLLGRCFPWRA